MLKQRLEHKLLQKLSPQQIQMIKLLEIPTMQMEQRIKKEMEENPVLEEGKENDDEFGDDQQDEYDENQKEEDEFSIDDYLNEEDEPAYKLSTSNYSKDDKQKEIPFSVGSNFKEHLYNQIGLQSLGEQKKNIAEYILGNIDEDGYLRRDIESIVNDLAFLQNVMVEKQEVEDVLTIIQDLDPAGVGARDLRECLLLQLKRKDLEKPTNELALKIVADFYDEFIKKHYDKIKSRTGASDELLKNAIHEITKLNPKPGGSYSDPQNKSFQHIVPDFILDNSEGDLQLSLNSRNVPDLKVNKTYSNMLKAYAENKKNQTKEQKEAVGFVKQKLDAAKWFIDAIKQRQTTLLLTMNAIIERQKKYFQEGDETKLRPMILKDIAEDTGLDISTISRVANSKYIQTHFGIHPLKYFFSEGMQTDSGEEVSTREIKTILQDCIGNEDKNKPLTDEKLAEILKEKGYNIARRTVAKYREQLNVPVARLRKEL